MLRDILPTELKDTKIKYDKYQQATYIVEDDEIRFNKDLLLKDRVLYLALCYFLHKKLSRKQYVIFCLLHEIGHRRDFMNRKPGISEYFCEKQILTISLGINYHKIEGNFRYWNEVTTERNANKFAKEYFFKYLLKQAIKKGMR